MNRSAGSGAGEQPFWRQPTWWRSTGQASVAIVLGTALSFIATVVVARALAPETFGLVLLAITTVAAVTTLLDLSLEEAVVFHGAHADTAGDHAGVRALLRASVRLDAAVGVAVFLILAAVAEPFADAVGGSALPPAYVRIAALETLTLTVNGTTGATLLLAGRPHLRAWTMAGTSGCKLVAVWLVVAGGASGTGVLWAYVVGAAAGSLVQACVATVVARRTWTVGRGSLPVDRRRLLRFGLQSSITTTITSIQTATVAAVLARRAGPVQVAIFQIAMFPVYAVSILTSPIRLTSMAEQARLYAAGRIDVLRRSVSRYTRWALSAGLAGAATAAWALGWLLPFVYTDRYGAAVTPARLLLPAAVAALATAWAKQLPVVIGRPVIRTAIAAAELIVTVSFVMLLAERGAEGAAIAVSVGYAVTSLTWLVVGRRVLRPAGRAAPLGGATGGVPDP